MTKTQRLVTFAMLCPLSLLPNAAQGTAVNALSSVKRIYVSKDFGKKAESDRIRRDLMTDLKKSKTFEVVDSEEQADAVLSGAAEVYITGHYSLNPRAGVSPRRGEPIYGGSFSVELKDKSGDPLWSYLATPRSAMTDPSNELARDVVKHLIDGQRVQKR